MAPRIILQLEDKQDRRCSLPSYPGVSQKTLPVTLGFPLMPPVQFMHTFGGRHVLSTANYAGKDKGTVALHLHPPIILRLPRTATID